MTDEKLIDEVIDKWYAMQAYDVKDKVHAMFSVIRKYYDLVEKGKEKDFVVLNYKKASEK
jgi:hypothetical protein